MANAQGQTNLPQFTLPPANSSLDTFMGQGGTPNAPTGPLEDDGAFVLVGDPNAAQDEDQEHRGNRSQNRMRSKGSAMGMECSLSVFRGCGGRCINLETSAG
jgi:hypothetical protein